MGMLLSFYSIIKGDVVDETYNSDFFSGALIGIANLIPGVSGGTMAVLLGIYDVIIDAIQSCFKPSKKMIQSLVFLMILGLGAVVSIVLFSSVFLWVLSSSAVLVSYFFIGLIVGSIPSILNWTAGSQKSPHSLISVFVGVLVFFAMIWFAFQQSGTTMVNISSHSQEPWYMALSGFIAAASMIVPGISGSLVLVIMGAYVPIIQAISTINISMLIWLVVGAILGIILTSRLIHVCLNQHFRVMQAIILGLVVGSIFQLFHPITFDLVGLKSLVLCLMGAFLAKRLSKINPS